MPDTSEENLFNEFYMGFKDLFTIIETQEEYPLKNLSVQARKVVAEATLFLHEMISHVDLEEVEKEFVISWLRQFGHILGREYEGNVILRFHYFFKNYQEDPAKTTHSLISIVVALRALETCGPKITREGTVWGYFLRDMPKFRRELEHILMENNSDEKNDELFLLLNTVDLLSLIKDSKEISYELEEFIKLISQLQESFDKAFEISPGLKVYAADLVDRIGLPIKNADLPTELPNKPGAFLALMQLRKGEIPSFEKLNRVSHPSALHLWWIAKAWTRRKIGEKLIGILPFYRRLNVDKIFCLVWGDIRELNKISITGQEMDYVIKLRGQDIKTQLYEYFKKHSKVTTYSQSRLAAERDKADAGGEISDFNVELSAGTDNIWAAIPIKSGRESGSRTREKMEQNFLYQFVRPLVAFETNKVVVYPIILVKPTLNANEFLSLIRARLQLPILVLDINIYTRFLKREKLLPS